MDEPWRPPSARPVAISGRMYGAATDLHTRRTRQHQPRPPTDSVNLRPLHQLPKVLKPGTDVPESVQLLPPCMVLSASLGPLVASPGLPDRTATGLSTAAPRAVPIAPIASRAHRRQPLAPPAYQESSVARGSAAFPTGRRTRCESGSKALYSPPGLVPCGGSGLLVCHDLGSPLPVAFQQRIIAQPQPHLALPTRTPTSTPD